MQMKTKLITIVQSMSQELEKDASLVYLTLYFSLFFVLILSYPVEASFNAAFNTRELSSQLRGYAIESGLYKSAGENTVDMYKEPKEQYDVSIKYYEEYCKDEDSANICSVYGKTLYEVIQEEEGLNIYFVENDEKKIILKEEYDTEDYKTSITKAIYGKAISSMRSNEKFATLNSKINRYAIYEVVISIFTSSAIFYLILPLCLHDGKTLGKLIMKSSLANTAGFKVKKIQIVVRYFCFVAFNIFSLIMGSALPFSMLIILIPFISFTMMIFSKKQTTLHDLCAATIVVDDNTSIIYKNQMEYEEAMKEEYKYEIERKNERLKDVKNGYENN